MRICPFCGSRADSLEHVIPQWIYRRIYPGTNGAFPVFVGHFHETQGYVGQRTQRSLNLKARLACVSCNTGWLSQMEGEVSRTLDPLVKNEFPHLAHEFLNLLGPDAQLIARWLAKTALTTSLSLPGSGRLSMLEALLVFKRALAADASSLFSRSITSSCVSAM